MIRQVPLLLIECKAFEGRIARVNELGINAGMWSGGRQSGDRVFGVGELRLLRTAFGNSLPAWRRATSRPSAFDSTSV